MFFSNFLAFFYDSADVGNLICCSSAFFKSSLNMWKFLVHVLMKPGLENFEHYFASVWDECTCAVVWTFFGIAFLWDWNENWAFAVLWSFPFFFFLSSSIFSFLFLIILIFKNLLYFSYMYSLWILIFSSPLATTEFSKFAGILSAALSQHHLSGFEIAQLEFHHLH